MLYSVDSEKYVNTLPHKKDFDRWRSHLADSDYAAVIEAINEKIDANEVNMAGWLPGSEWTGTVFEPLYYACGRNKVQSGMFFGLIVFNILLHRPDKVWGFGRYEKNGVALSSMTYFVIDNPPSIKG